MSDPSPNPGQAPLPGVNFDGLRKVAGAVGNLLFAVAKEGLAAYVAQMYACEWNVEDKLRIRKIKQQGGNAAWIVFDFNHAEKDAVRLTFECKWEQRPHGNLDYQAEWRAATEFKTFEEAAAIAAEFIQHRGKG